MIDYFKQADMAWLELGDTDMIHTGHVFAKIHHTDEKIAAYEFMKIITDPNYLHVLCKEVLDIQLLPIQNVIMQELWNKKFPMLIGSRGFGKTFSLAILCIIKALLVPGIKIVITGAGFRQAKFVYDNIENIWLNAPILRDVCDKNSGSFKDSDRWNFRINDSSIVAIPLGVGDKIRGMRANLIISEEFNVVDTNIYEKVVQGFASVSAKPVDQVRLAAKREYLMSHGMWTSEQQKEFETRLGNQSIISGTAGYHFENLAKYWQRYHSIIHGDKAKMEEILGEVADQFDPSDFTIIRVPYELIPSGFMDDKLVMRARATMHEGNYLTEYAACFVKDSEGFFKRSLIESCVARDGNIEILKARGRSIIFDVALNGDSERKYIIGVDPAASVDNLAIVVLELHDDHWRIVYCWTTNAAEHKRLLKEGRISQDNYYSFCARKIRDLMLTFPTAKIGIDGQGGGKAIMEALHDKSIMLPGEEQIWPVKDPDKEQDTDDKYGAHIIEKIEFADAKWTADANNFLRKDMEMKYILFPRYDAISLGLAAEHDLLSANKEGQNYESIEGIIAEIEELKNELSIIQMTQTDQGKRDRWDTPETKDGTGKKGRLKKDRYSALVIANMIAHTMSRSEPAMQYAFVGGTTKDLAKEKLDTTNIYGPNTWYNVNPDIFGAVSQKRRRV